MNLVGSLVVKNELNRYLTLVVPHLLTFCDELRVVDDHSTDDTFEYLHGLDRVRVIPAGPEGFFEHEGRTRQRLLEWTLDAAPTHVLAVDADEFVSDGPALRDVEGWASSWELCLAEVWNVTAERLFTREDGGWRTHGVPLLWKVPPHPQGPDWVIQDVALACGREPLAIRHDPNRGCADVDVFHFGWANQAERVARHARYAEADGGRYHASHHLDSILNADWQIAFGEREWPAGLAGLAAEIAARANR